MKKKFLTCVLALFMLFSALGSGCSKEENTTNELIWNNYVESVDAYVSDIYYYTVPEVKDQNGNVYEVSVDVRDQKDDEVDFFGGFFLVENAEQYKISYSVDDGKNVTTKVTTVIGIEKAKYEITTTDLIFAVNEKVNLEGIVEASNGQQVSYSVKMGDTSISVSENGFTPTETGVYNVLAKADKQPTYSFDIYVVDAEDRAYADGVILDGTAVSDFKITSSDNFQTDITFTDSVKYDSQSNGSYKICAKTTPSENIRTASFSIKPTYSSDYYKLLQKNGYKYVAIRFMIDSYSYEGTTRMDYISSSGSDEMAIYYDGEKIVDKRDDTASYTFWQNQLDKTPKGAWAEMLLDITKFTTYYNDQELSLFQFVVNGDKVEKGNSSCDITMYIDNIYVVKDELKLNDSTKIVELNTQIDLSEEFIGTDLKNPIRTVLFDGEEFDFTEEKFTVDAYGLYSVVVTERTKYGSVKKDIFPKGAVVSYAKSSFSAVHGTGLASDNGFEVVKDNKNYQMTISPNTKCTISGNWHRTTYTVKSLGDVDYYEQLKSDGYAYITYEYVLDYGTYTLISGTDIYRATLTKSKIPHYNSDGLNKDTAATHKWLCVDDNTSGDTSTKTQNIYFQSTSYADLLWNGKAFIISVSIDDFIRLYDEKGMNILTLYYKYSQPNMEASVTFGKILATKNACSFDN